MGHLCLRDARKDSTHHRTPLRNIAPFQGRRLLTVSPSPPLPLLLPSPPQYTHPIHTRTRARAVPHLHAGRHVRHPDLRRRRQGHPWAGGQDQGRRLRAAQGGCVVVVRGRECVCVRVGMWRRYPPHHIATVTCNPPPIPHPFIAIPAISTTIEPVSNGTIFFPSPPPLRRRTSNF